MHAEPGRCQWRYCLRGLGRRCRSQRAGRKEKPAALTSDRLFQALRRTILGLLRNRGSSLTGPASPGSRRRHFGGRIGAEPPVVPRCACSTKSRIGTGVAGKRGKLSRFHAAYARPVAPSPGDRMGFPVKPINTSQPVMAGAASPKVAAGIPSIRDIRGRVPRASQPGPFCPPRGSGRGGGRTCSSHTPLTRSCRACPAISTFVTPCNGREIAHARAWPSLSKSSSAGRITSSAVPRSASANARARESAGSALPALSGQRAGLRDLRFSPETHPHVNIRAWTEELLFSL